MLERRERREGNTVLWLHFESVTRPLATTVEEEDSSVDIGVRE